MAELLQFRATVKDKSPKKEKVVGYYYKNETANTFHIIKTIKHTDDRANWTQDLIEIDRKTLELLLPNGESVLVDEYVKALLVEEPEDKKD
jgi:hypothetical protein